MPQGLDSADLHQLQEENRRLKRAVTELSILNELASAIGATTSSDGVIRTIVDRSVKAVEAEQGLITLVDENEQNSAKTLIRAITPAGGDGYHFNQALLGWIILNRKPLIADDPANDKRFMGMSWNPSVRSILCVPMLIRARLKGVLTVFNKKGGRGFSTDDQRLLAIIASQSAQVIENARLFEKERALVGLQKELELASSIQAGLLPRTFPRINGYDIAGVTIPASKVGGDYFDFIPLTDKRMAICVGDVSGKQLPAALLMANLQAALRSHTQLAASVKECIARSNAHLYGSMGPDKFASLFYGILDTKHNCLTYCNAGHEPPFLFKKDKRHHRLGVGGTVLGVIEGFMFEEATVSFDPGDILIAYSDGITEAMNESSQQFGEEKLAEFIRKNSERSAARLIQEIVDAVKLHAGKTPQHDDITAVVVKRIS